MQQKKQTAGGSPSSRTPVKITAAPWKMTLPGCVLIFCICLLPFITFSVDAPLTNLAREMFLLSSSTYQDFEQICREVFLCFLAVLSVVWFFVERLTLRPKREMPLNRPGLMMLLLALGYLLLGLLSTLFSEHTLESWIGSYTLYEGYIAIWSYGVVFAAAWYWVDREEVVSFLKGCLTVLSIVLGVLCVLEPSGISYYNFSLIHWLGRLAGYVSYTGDAVLTFGNADYLGMYCALLLPVQVSWIQFQDDIKTLLLRIVAAVLLAAALLLTHVSSAILFGFGTTLAYLLVAMFHNGWKRAAHLAVTAVVVVAILCAGIGFIWTRSGSTLGEKLEHTVVGADLDQTTFHLLSLDMDENVLTLKNADTTFEIHATENTDPTGSLSFVCNGETVSGREQNGVISFTEPALSHVQISITENQVSLDLGYQTPLETIWNGQFWQVVGIGGRSMTIVPEVSDNAWLQQRYTYLNGRVFVWTNTLFQLDDCILLGHGPATSVYYLTQNDLPALLNIFGLYVIYNKPHNWYLQIAQDTGILSLLLILGILGVYFVKGAPAAFGRKKHPWSPYRCGLWLGILSYALCGIMSDSLIYHAPMFWLLLGVGTRELVTCDGN